MVVVKNYFENLRKFIHDHKHEINLERTRLMLLSDQK
jgi:hypothetical protein